MQTPPNTTGWALGSFGKYIFVTNYDDLGTGAFQNIPEQRLGVFDTERKTFCQLDVVVPGNASVEHVSVATPGARQSRVYFQGLEKQGSTGAAFGYVEADLDVEDPCVNWPVHAFTGAYLNAHTAPGVASPCPPGDGCGFDGITALDASTVALSGWAKQVLVVVHVDPSGVVLVKAVHQLPLWKAPGGNACYTLNPVSRISVDRTFAGPGQRFVSMFDTTCATEVDPPGCQPWVKTCPDTGAACPGSCSGYCQNDVTQACGADEDCQPVLFELLEGCGGILLPSGPCTTACRATHPNQRCKANPTIACVDTDDCPGGDVCDCVPPGRPAQEFAFDGTNLTPTGPRFQPAIGSSMRPLGLFDSGGSLISTDTDDAVLWAKNPTTGTHAYHDPLNSTASAIVPYDYSLGFVHSPFTNLDGATGTVQHGEFMYMAGYFNIQRSRAGFGVWALDTLYKRGLGDQVLPPERQVCSCSLGACSVDADCPSGETCILGGHTRENFRRLVVGGAPPSATMMVSYQGLIPAPGNGAPVPDSTYILRTPVATILPDGVAVGRAAIAWNSKTPCASSNCDRMWLTARRSTGLSFRVRDDGQWSGWGVMPANITTIGSPAIVASGNEVDAFVRGSDRMVYQSNLTSGVDCKIDACTPGVNCCTWSPWVVIPNSPVTDHDPAAARSAWWTWVAVRRASDATLWTTQRLFSSWLAWTQGPSIAATDAPTLAYDSVVGRLWLGARSGGVAYAARIYPNEAWSVVGSGGGVSWGQPPTLVSDGGRMRAFAAAPGSGSSAYWTFQAIHDGSSWGNWRVVPSFAGTTSQPMAANVNGDVNLFTNWLTHGIEEHGLE